MRNGEGGRRAYLEKHQILRPLSDVVHERRRAPDPAFRSEAHPPAELRRVHALHPLPALCLFLLYAREVEAALLREVCKKDCRVGGGYQSA